MCGCKICKEVKAGVKSGLKCKYCGRQMNVNALEYTSNQYCNKCFNDRAKEAKAFREPNSFSFMEEVFKLKNDTN